MADDADFAAELAERERSASVSNIRAAGLPVDLTECVECGEAILPRRRASVPNAIRCTGCQAEHERSAA